MTGVSDKILATGKYLNVIKKYDKASQCPYSNDLIENHELYLKRQDFSECVDKAFEWANQELIRIVVNEKKLVARLTSIKYYFFLQAGDFFIHFMDSAGSELAKEPVLISQEKLQSLLEMSIRTSSADSDPFKDDVYCYLAGFHFSQILASYQGLAKKELHKMEFMIGNESTAENRNKAAKGSKGHDYFTLGYNVEWPLNLILTETNLILYKLVFKNFFALRFTEYELYNCWSKTKDMKTEELPGYAKGFFLLLQRMINFVRNVIYSFCIEVVEERWKTFLSNLQNVVEV